MTAIDRFLCKVSYPDDTDCWLWTASKYYNGYGQFLNGNGRKICAHRFSYENFVGPIPDGLQLDHLCAVRHCVNPQHLEPVSIKRNQERMSGVRVNSTSGIRGVQWYKRLQKWRVRVSHYGKTYSGGMFDDIGEAEQRAIALRNELYGNDPARRDHHDQYRTNR